MANNIELLDLLIINNNLVLDEKGSPQLIGGRSVVAQDVKHRILDSGYVYRLIGERNRNVIQQILNRLELIIENDLRVIAGTVKTKFKHVNNEANLEISCESYVGDVLIDLPVIPEELQDKDGSNDNLEPKVIFYLPRIFGAADSDIGEVLEVEKLSLGSGKNIVDRVIKLGEADLVVNNKDIKITEEI